MPDTKRVARHAFGAAALVCVLRCAAPAPPATGAPSGPATPSAATTGGAPAESSGPVRQSQLDAAVRGPEASAPLGTDPRRFRCGIGSCRVGDETCCLAGDEGVCLETTPNDAPPGKIGYLRSQLEACNDASLPHGYSLSGIERCDESIDCAKGALCCDQFLFSGATMSECVAFKPGTPTPCDYGERCIDDAGCRLAGTVCIEGICRKPIPKLRCDGAPCGDGEVCCGDPLGCRAAADCPSYHQVRCSTHAHCISGQRCAVVGAGADCLNLLQDPNSQQFVCRRDSDCTVKCPSAQGKPARCRPSAIPWLRSCQCPDP